jgi:hypothetical protein
MIGIASNGADLRARCAGKNTAHRFVTFWHGVKVSTLEWICIKSFIDQGHEYHLYAYSDVIATCHFPPGTIIRPAEEILPRERLFYFEKSPSAFSNLFRYKLLGKTSAWWVDTDVYCRGSQIPNVDYCWSEEEPGQINGAILKLGTDKCLAEALYAAALDRSSTITRWGQLGPNLLTEYLASKRPLSHYGTQQSLYPIHWLEAYYYWLPEFHSEVILRTDKALFHHFWHSVLVRAMGIDGSAYPPEGSFMASVWTSDIPRQVDYTTPSDIRQRIKHYLSQSWVQKACTKRGISLKPPI